MLEGLGQGPENIPFARGAREKLNKKSIKRLLLGCLSTYVGGSGSRVSFISTGGQTYWFWIGVKYVN